MFPLWSRHGTPFSVFITERFSFHLSNVLSEPEGGSGTKEPGFSTDEVKMVTKNYSKTVNALISNLIKRRGEMLDASVISVEPPNLYRYRYSYLTRNPIKLINLYGRINRPTSTC